jgi:hypothetical protein
MDTASKVARDHEAKPGKLTDSEQERALDHALEETFPGSDPVNLAQPPRSKQERRNEKSPTAGGRSA